MWTFGDLCECGAPATLLLLRYYGSQTKEGDATPTCDTCGHRTLASIERDGDVFDRGRGGILALNPPYDGRSLKDSPKWPSYTTA